MSVTVLNAPEPCRRSGVSPGARRLIPGPVLWPILWPVLWPVLWAVSLGGAGCARSVNDYLAEARSNAPGAVKDAVISIGEILLRKERAGLAFDEADREALLYLKDVATQNPVPVNRAVALRALSRLRGSGASDVFRGALRDPFWLARFHAVGAMEAEPEESYAEPLRQLLSTETHAEVRLLVVKALARIQGPLALRTLLEVFLARPDGPKDPQVHAFVAIRSMTGLSYGFDELRSWEEYYRSRFGQVPSLPGPPPGPAAGGDGGAAPPDRSTGR